MDHASALVQRIKAAEPLLWANPKLEEPAAAQSGLPFSPEDVHEAAQTWQRLAPALSARFPELAASGGSVESELLPVPALKNALGLEAGNLLIKADHSLPVAGSIKARGGLFEVFVHALTIAEHAGLISNGQPVERLLDPEVRSFFSKHTISVGSTGNLGLSVGVAGRALGFNVVVHMSHDAKAWKIKRLEDAGAAVVQHKADYGSAVDEARRQSEGDDAAYFVDDERSELLFKGYSAAAPYLAEQIKKQGIEVGPDHPLFVYLPCGIGGAPGGVAYGLKQIFGAYAHCFFIEPVQAPCALVQWVAGLEKPVSVYDYGLTNRTEADGMAVGLVSQYVAQIMERLVSGVITIEDDDLYRWLAQAKDCENIELEPSAASCIGGPGMVLNSAEGQAYLKSQGIENKVENASHVLWTTGGAFVPPEIYQSFLTQGRKLLAV